jgi:hypothetical protein
MTKLIPARVPKSDWLQLPGRSDRAYDQDERKNVLGVKLGVAFGARGAREREREERAGKCCDPAHVSAQPRVIHADQGRTDEEGHVVVVCGRAGR